MKTISITIILLVFATSLFAQKNDFANENANITTQDKYAEETHEGHNHDVNHGGAKGCDPILQQKVNEIIPNGTCPALEEYYVWDSGKTFYEYFTDFPKCPQLGNYISDKEGYFKAITDWFIKHPDDEELVRQILPFGRELPPTK
jgi:hypothetical protein